MSIIITMRNTELGRERSVTIAAEVAPSLRSAINEIRNEIGGRTEGAFAFKKEHSLTRAAIGLGQLGATINHVVPEDDPDYE